MLKHKIGTVPMVPNVPAVPIVSVVQPFPGFETCQRFMKSRGLPRFENSRNVE
jgi:hypothetical protein